jgi:hypothetical protein
MSTATVADYTAKRAELLAALVLTRREGARVVAFKDPQEDGFLVQLPRPDEGAKKNQHLQPYFSVHVGGTNDRLDDERRAAAHVRGLWKGLSEEGFGFFLAPVVFLLFSMEGDQGYFTWVLEPRVDREKGPSLTRVESPEMTRITKRSIEEVFDRVEEWFKATAVFFFRE